MSTGSLACSRAGVFAIQSPSHEFTIGAFKRAALRCAPAMSLLKQIDPASGQVADVTPQTPTPDARAAFADGQQEVVNAVHHMEDAFTVALKEAEDKVSTLQAQNTALQAQIDTLTKTKAESDAKLAVLAELKARLAGI